jgi:hypothetical protein
LPLCSSFSAQVAANELLPKPAGALMTASRLAGSSDKIARSRGRATSPPSRTGTILVARNGSCPAPGKVRAPFARWLDRGWINGSPYPRRSSPHSGDASNGESVRSLFARGKRWVSSAVGISHARRRVLIPSRLRAELKQADVYQGRALGFRADN